MKVKFVPDNLEFEVSPNESVMELAHRHGVKIHSVCGGLPSCAECRVKIVEGENNVLPPGRKELVLIGTGYFVDRRRLSCQLKCFGDVVVDTSEQSEKQLREVGRRPQGSLRKDDEVESFAVTGNLIEEEKELLQETAVNSRKTGKPNKKKRSQRRHGGRKR